ncbi:unnamed protein product [Urochloa humidicola]
MEQADVSRRLRQRRRFRPTYRIGDLPDDVLHSILLRVGSAPAAARTSVLSSRWQGVWAHLPVLVFHDSGGQQHRNPSSFLNSIDAALDRYSAPTLRFLYISMFNMSSRVPAARVSPWLRFASQRVAGDLMLLFPYRADGEEDEEEELELPVCGKMRTLQLGVGHGFRQLRLPRTGVFAALYLIIIRDARIDANDLERVVCWQCPCLVDLHLTGISLVAVADVTVRSGSLKRLHFEVENTSRLVLDTPSIEELSLSNVVKVSVVTPKFAQMAQRHGAEDPHRQLLGRRLRRLVVKGSHQVMPVLMRHFDAVDQLELDLTVSTGEGYKTFLRATNKLANCDVLVVKLTMEWHAYEPSLLYLVRKSAGIRKLVVHLPWTECSPCMPGCTCGRKGSEKTDNIKLDSLEVVEINDFTGEYHQDKIVKLLLSCKDISASRIVVNISPFVCSLSEGTCQRIRNEAHPSTNIKFNVWLQGRWEPYA